MQTSLFWFIYKAILKFMCLWIFCPSGEYSYGNVSCPIPLLKLQNDHVLDILFFWLWPWCFIKKKKPTCIHVFVKHFCDNHFLSLPFSLHVLKWLLYIHFIGEGHLKWPFQNLCFPVLYNLVNKFAFDTMLGFNRHFLHVLW